MKSRIDKILQEKEMSSSQFADEIRVQRSSISHILSGRNNPSMDFVKKLLTRFGDINAEWLLIGKGNMYKDESSTNLPSADQILDFSASISQEAAAPPKMVQKIIVYYSDNSFEEFNKGV